MKCGNCKNDHATVAEVRGCYGIVRHAPEWSKPSTPTETPVEKFRRLAALLPEVERAHYAIKQGEHFAFYCVDKPAQGRWTGYTFVKLQASDEYYKISFARSLEVLEAIASDPAKALSDYGHELGQCGVCNRTLTNPESIAAGIGPICAGRI